MDPALRERLGWRTSIDVGVTAPASPVAMARAALWFWGAGSLIALLALVVPHGDEVDEPGLAGVVVATAAMGVLTLLRFDRLPRWFFHLGTLAASAVATAAIHFWGVGTGYGPLPYLFVTLYAFFFFERRWALLHMAAIGGLFALELGAEDSVTMPIGSWVATLATLISAGLLLSIVRDRLASLVSNLTDSARKDPLTGLLSRNAFEQALDLELERSRRAEGGVSLIVTDLDDLAAVNRRSGRGAGDDALRRAAAIISDGKRAWDAAARVGGDEFAILAPDTDEHGAYILAERVRSAVEQSFSNGGSGPLTASFGIVSCPVHGDTPEALLLAAERALAAAKKLGCNRSVISSAEVPGILARAPGPGRDAPVELATLLNLAEALDVRDSGHSAHCRRVGRYAELIARELGLTPESIERVRIAGILHDVGRVGVPDELMKRKGPLEDEDWHWIRSHPATGARMLATTEFGDIGEWILAHHERPDGTGYPGGRRSEELPIEASILGVADAYEAMTTKRPYRAPLEPAAAAEELRKGAGRQFDERVVRALLNVV